MAATRTVAPPRGPQAQTSPSRISHCPCSLSKHAHARTDTATHSEHSLLSFVLCLPTALGQVPSSRPPPFLTRPGPFQHLDSCSWMTHFLVLLCHGRLSCITKQRLIGPWNAENGPLPSLNVLRSSHSAPHMQGAPD